jgi:hypothetical protein
MLVRVSSESMMAAALGGTQNTASVIRFRSKGVAPEAKALCAG